MKLFRNSSIERAMIGLDKLAPPCKRWFVHVSFANTFVHVVPCKHAYLHYTENIKTHLFSFCLQSQNL